MGWWEYPWDRNSFSPGRCSFLSAPRGGSGETGGEAGRKCSFWGRGVNRQHTKEGGVKSGIERWGANRWEIRTDLAETEQRAEKWARGLCTIVCLFSLASHSLRQALAFKAVFVDTECFSHWAQIAGTESTSPVGVGRAQSPTPGCVEGD